MGAAPSTLAAPILRRPPSLLDSAERKDWLSACAPPAEASKVELPANTSRLRNCPNTASICETDQEPGGPGWMASAGPAWMVTLSNMSTPSQPCGVGLGKTGGCNEMWLL